MKKTLALVTTADISTVQGVTEAYYVANELAERYELHIYTTEAPDIASTTYHPLPNLPFVPALTLYNVILLPYFLYHAKRHDWDVVCTYKGFSLSSFVVSILTNATWIADFRTAPISQDSEWEYFQNKGCVVQGVEGDKKALSNAVIDTRDIAHFDLRDPYSPDQKYDLVLCFEVAEHIPKQFADNLVESISKAGDTAAFTAAPPGQPGKHHINCQPRDHWIEKFSAEGFQYNPDNTDRLATQMDVTETDWIPANLFIFERS